MKKILLLCLAFTFASDAYSSEKACSRDEVSANAFNNFILVQDQSFNDSLKEVSEHIESSDGYINSNSHVKFGHCGSLLEVRGKKITNAKIKDNSVVTQVDTVLDKKEGGWNYNMTFSISIVEKDGTTKNMMTQEMKGEFLTGSNGRINKSEDFSDILIGKNHESARAVTTFLIDDKDRLSQSNRVSTLNHDSVNKIYNYNSQNRLIKTSSDSTTEEFTYGSDNRELSSKMVQKFFTTETTITTCNDWNKFGRCTNAKQHISTLIKDDKSKQEHAYNHLADVKYDYIY